MQLKNPKFARLRNTSSRGTCDLEKIKAWLSCGTVEIHWRKQKLVYRHTSFDASIFFVVSTAFFLAIERRIMKTQLLQKILMSFLKTKITQNNLSMAIVSITRTTVILTQGCGEKTFAAFCSENQRCFRCFAVLLLKQLFHYFESFHYFEKVFRCKQRKFSLH